MKLTIKRIISIATVLIILTFILVKCSDIMQRKSSDYKYIPFFEHASDYDVLFMGTSHVINAVFPMELWNDYGITSYNCGGHSNEIATTYWVMENALDYANPKVIVIDCAAVENMVKTSLTFEFVHLSLDAFPISGTKIKTVFDLLDDPLMKECAEAEMLDDAGEKRTKMGLLWDFSVYHGRWKELDVVDFESRKSFEYGAEANVLLAKPAKFAPNTGLKLESETVGLKYLRKMIESCKEKDIEVLLTYIPYPITSTDDWREINTIYDIAKEYNVNYINFLDENIVNFATDCADSSSHLNPSGAYKVTDYLGNYLKENYDLTDYRTVAKYEYWNDAYSLYSEKNSKALARITDFNTHLMFLSNKNYGYIIYIEDSSLLQDDTTINLLKNKGVDTTKISQNTKYIVASGDKCAVINKDSATLNDLFFNFNNISEFTEAKTKVISFNVNKISDENLISVIQEFKP